MLNIPFYFLFSLLTDDDFPPKTMEFRHFAMGKVRSALKSLSRRCCFLAARALRGRYTPPLGVLPAARSPRPDMMRATR